MSAEFDEVSRHYDDLLNSATAMTGFDAGEFAEAKLKRLASLLPDLVEAGGAFLDYGCGGGNLFAHFADYFLRTVYTGTDPSPGMIEQARKKFGDRGRFLETASPEWKAGRYDLVFVANVLHHIPHNHHERVLRELCGLLNPGGRLVIWEHNPRNPVTRKIVRDCEFDRDAVLVPVARIKRLLKGLRLDAVTLQYTTFFPKWLGFLSGLEPALGWCPLGGQYVIYGKKPDNEDWIF